MNKTLIGWAVVALVVAGFITVVVRFGPGKALPEELTAAEVREYQGQDLSSIRDFRENSIKGPQYIDINEYKLEITGLVEKDKSYTYEQLTADYPRYKKVVRLNCVEGWSVDILWEGILLKELLAEAKPLPSANVVIFYAYDGYSTSHPLDFIIDNNIIMADKMNDVIIPPERGFPFQLVAESKWGYKWAKWITKIELSDDVNFRGYWERVGYSNTGNLSESQFDFFPW